MVQHPLSATLSRAFYAGDAVAVARALLGQRLVRILDGVRLSGRICETEAYRGPDDAASHGYRRTPRSSIMYGPPGIAYVYFIYGNHHCLNVVTDADGVSGAFEEIIFARNTADGPVGGWQRAQVDGTTRDLNLRLDGGFFGGLHFLAALGEQRVDRRRSLFPDDSVRGKVVRGLERENGTLGRLPKLAVRAPLPAGIPEGDQRLLQRLHVGAGIAVGSFDGRGSIACGSRRFN